MWDYVDLLIWIGLEVVVFVIVVCLLVFCVFIFYFIFSFWITSWFNIKVIVKSGGYGKFGFSSCLIGLCVWVIGSVVM